MSKYIVFMMLFMVLTGCTKEPSLTVYSLTAPNVKSIHNSSYAAKSIKVSSPQSLKEQISQKMNFSYSISDRGTYLNSEWSNNMSKLLQGTFIEVIDSANIFKVVLSDISSLKENYRLESNLYTFEHQVRGTQSHAIVSVQFTLINADTGKLVKSKRFSYKEVTSSVDARGYVSATNVAMARLSNDLVGWLR